MPILYLACPAPHLGSSVLSAHNGKVLGSLEGPRGTSSPVTNCSGLTYQPDFLSTVGCSCLPQGQVSCWSGFLQELRGQFLTFPCAGDPAQACTSSYPEGFSVGSWLLGSLNLEGPR